MRSLIAIATWCISPLLFGQARTPSGFEAWPVPIEQRVYAGTFSRTPQSRSIALTACRNEFVSAQLACRNDRDGDLTFQKSPLRGPDGAEIPPSAIRVRFGAFLPVDETRQFTADPLLETPSVRMPANLAQPVWVTLHVPKDAQPGNYSGSLALTAGRSSVQVPLRVDVLPATLPDPPDYKFYLNIWQDPNGVARAHHVKLWSEEHWRLLALYARNLAMHGEDSIMTSIIFDPWNSQTGYVFPAMVEWKCPGEWTAGRESRFTWDFTIFDRYVNLMMAAGVREKIDMYAMVKGPGSTPDASIRYRDTKTNTYRTEKLKVGDEKWKAAWSVFLPALKAHLMEKGWWKVAYLGFDEKPKELMDKLFAFIGQAGPDYKLVMSGGNVRDVPRHEVVLYWDEINNPDEWKNRVKPMAESLRSRGQLVTFYTACAPRFPNTFLYSSLRESRMLPWIAWKYDLLGYTRWAVNAFPDDVWTQPNFKWHSGDMYFLYPGEKGPLDGMRWELLRQGIEDYEALRIAHEMASSRRRADLLKKLDRAVARATILDSCRDIPPVQEARDVVNSVLRELGAPERK